MAVCLLGTAAEAVDRKSKIDWTLPPPPKLRNGSKITIKGMLYWETRIEGDKVKIPLANQPVVLSFTVAPTIAVATTNTDINGEFVFDGVRVLFEQPDNKKRIVSVRFPSLCPGVDNCDDRVLINGYYYKSKHRLGIIRIEK